MKTTLMILATVLMAFSVNTQENPTQKNDTWYVWLHATAIIDGKETIVVSKDVFTTYCCVNSSEFSKLIKRSRKWMQKNVDPNYVGSPLQKVQDRELAKQTLAKLKATAGVFIVDYTETCK